VTGDDILAILEAVSPSKISLSKLTHAMVPVMDKLGFRTSQQSQAVWQAEPGRVMLAFLCVLAWKSLTVDEVQQTSDQCVLVAKLPLGVITNPGKLLARLETKSGWVRASLAVTISGQWYDWGKSKRLIEDILSGINLDLTDQYSGRSVVYQRVA